MKGGIEGEESGGKRERKGRKIYRESECRERGEREGECREREDQGERGSEEREREEGEGG